MECHVVTQALNVNSMDFGQVNPLRLRAIFAPDHPNGGRVFTPEKGHKKKKHPSLGHSRKNLVNVFQINVCLFLFVCVCESK